MNLNTRDEETWRIKENVLIEQLKEVCIYLRIHQNIDCLLKVRAQLERNATTRRGLQKSLEDLKHRHDLALNDINRSGQQASDQSDLVNSQTRTVQLINQYAILYITNKINFLE